ncbi:MAG: FAD-dependent oxidoreductase [Deltaproteobacteria bacterium]|nr:FAD-dependent oxidoreductase [Deltaproteobacteria bacterium]
MNSRRVVIVGSGFAGFCLARSLDRLLASSAKSPLEVTLISPSAAASLSPLLPGVLSGWVEPWQMRLPLREALRRVRWMVGRAVHVDPEARRVSFDGPGVQTGCDPASLPFDDLVFACGTATDHQGVRGAQERCLPFRSLDDALRIRNRVSEVLEAASGEDSSRRRRALCTLVIVGSDPRACSAALELARRFRLVAPMFPRLEPGDPHVVLVSPEPQLCAAWGPDGSRFAKAQLDRAGVEVRSEARIESVADDHVVVVTPNGSERLDARTVVWTPSSAPSLCVARWSAAPLEQGRLRVDELLRVSGADCLYAIGDSAAGPASGLAAPCSPARAARNAGWLAAALFDRACGRTPRSIVGKPWIDPVLLDRDHGLAMVGARCIDGRAGAWLSRRLMIRHMPGLRRRAAVRVAWTLVCHVPSAENDPSRLQPAHQTLYLTPPPAPVTGGD